MGRSTAADREWMTRALAAARRADRLGEVPIGAVAVLDGKLLATAANRTTRALDPTAHAEVLAVRRAARRLGNHRLAGVTLYVTLEPCLMCMGAMVQARIGRLVFGARDPKVGGTRYLRSARVQRGLNHRFPVLGGVLADEAAALLKGFFAARR